MPVTSSLRLRLALLCSLLLAGCTLPPLEGRPRSSAPSPAETADTPLGRALAPLIAAHPGRSGIHPLSDPRDAFAAPVDHPAPASGGEAGPGSTGFQKVHEPEKVALFTTR